jgi:hypothetical protein
MKISKHQNPKTSLMRKRAKRKPGNQRTQPPTSIEDDDVKAFEYPLRKDDGIPQNTEFYTTPDDDLEAMVEAGRAVPTLLEI